MTFKVLCCDGGGIRGLITALLIQDLDNKFGIIGKADGYAGTSTGGLIALALAHGVKISTIVDIYKNRGGTIFKPNGWLLEEGKIYSGTPDQPGELLAGPGILSCQYTNSGLLGLASELFGEAAVSDCSKFVSVNTARLWDDGSWQPVTIANTPSNPLRTTRLADASLATSAAPTYFPPYAIGAYGYFADGGTFANNPSMTALGELLSSGLVPGLAELRMLSLGTGVSPQGIPSSAISDPLRWGVTHWMWPMESAGVPATALLNLSLDCTAYAAAQQAGQLLAGNYCRGNFKLQKAIPLDGWQMSGALVELTDAYLQTAQWEQVCSWVSSNWS